MIDPLFALGYKLFGAVMVVAFKDDMGRLAVTLISGNERSMKDRKAGTYIIGTIGSGKSTLLYNDFLKMIKAGHGAIIISTHGLKDLLPYIPPHLVEKTHVISPSRDRTPGINLLQRYSYDETERIQIADNLVGLLRKMDASIGGNMEELIFQATVAVLEAQERCPSIYKDATLYDVYRFLIDDIYRLDTLQHVLTQTVHDAFAKFNESSMEASIRRMRRLLSNPILISSLARVNGLNLKEIVRKGEIVICDLDQAELGMGCAEMIAEVLMSQMYIIASGRNEKMPYYCAYFDEFQTYSNDLINKFVEEGRKRNFPITLAHQRRGQLTRNQQEAVHLCGSWYVFQCTVEDAREVARAFPSPKDSKQEMWEKISRQPLYHIYYKERRGRGTYHGQRSTKPMPRAYNCQDDLWLRCDRCPTRGEVVQQVTTGVTVEWNKETVPSWNSLASFVAPPQSK